jgi:hypothetical protein
MSKPPSHPTEKIATENSSAKNFFIILLFVFLSIILQDKGKTFFFEYKRFTLFRSFLFAMRTLLATLRTGATIATDEETPYTAHKDNTNNNGYYRHHNILPVIYHSNNVIW